MATSAGAMSSGIHSRKRRRCRGSGVECCEAICIILDEYPKEIPNPRTSQRMIKSEWFGAKREHTEEAPLTVLTEVELVGLVCVSWSGSCGLPDVSDRQRAFCTYGRVKMSYMSVRG